MRLSFLAAASLLTAVSAFSPSPSFLRQSVVATMKVGGSWSMDEPAPEVSLTVTVTVTSRHVATYSIVSLENRTELPLI
jgi:hypothetical protein